MLRGESSGDPAAGGGTRTERWSQGDGGENGERRDQKWHTVGGQAEAVASRVGRAKAPLAAVCRSAFSCVAAVLPWARYKQSRLCKAPP